MTLMSRSKWHSIPPDIPKNTLIEFMLGHANPQQRAKAAKEAALSFKQFANLAMDSDEHVRMCLARNSATPPLILAELASDHQFTVRFWVAKHSECPSYILKTLINDAVDVVSMAARENLESKK